MSNVVDFKAPATAAFNGPEPAHTRDTARLNAQTRRVFNAMRDGTERTLEEISALTLDPAPSISAQLRHLRKKRFGAHTVDKRYVADGLYKYRLTINTAEGTT